MAITRNYYIPLIDQNKMQGTGAQGEYSWIRIDKSTTFTLAYNPQTETSGYIDAAADTTSITGYQMSLPEEIKIDETLESFRIIDEYFRKKPVGGDAVVPVIICRPHYENGVLSADKWDGELYTEATVVPDTEDITGGMKYTFTLNLNGDPIKGIVTKNEGGVFEFTKESDLPSEVTPPSTEPGGEETGGEEAASFSLKSKSSSK